MVDVAKVNMFGIPVGTFRWDEQYQIVRFEYDRSFKGEFILSPTLVKKPLTACRVYWPMHFPTHTAVRCLIDGLP